MRIVLVVNRFPPYSVGGVETLAVGLAHAFQSEGHEVQILCAELPQYAQSPSAFVDDVYLDIPVRRVWVDGAERSMTVSLANHDSHLEPLLRESLAFWEPDIVHVLSMTGLSGAVIGAARNHARKVFYTATGYGLFCPLIELRKPNGHLCNGHASFAKCYACCRPRNFRSVVLYMLTAWMSQRLFMMSTPQMERLRNKPIAVFEIGRALYQRRYYMSQVMSALDRVIAPSAWVKQALIWNGMPPERVSVVPHGVMTDVVGDGHKTQSEKVRFAYIGRITKIKGVDLLINAFRKLSKDFPISLAIYGPSSPDETDYLHLCQELARGDSRVSLMGSLSREEFPEAFKGIDVLVVPSVWHEVFGIVVQEALANQTPVIGTDIGGIPDLIEHGVNGLLFPMGDTKALTECLCQCCDPVFLARLRSGIGAVPTVEQEAATLLNLYCN